MGCRVEKQIIVNRVWCAVVAAFRYTRLLSLQRAAYDVSRSAAKCGKGFFPAVAEVDQYSLVAEMPEAPTVKELRSMSEVVKKVISVISAAC